MTTTTSSTSSAPISETVPTRQVVSPDALSPSVIERGLRLSVIEGAFTTVHIAITNGVYLTGFALLLGANTFILGLIGALPFVGQLFQFVSAYLEERTGARRSLVLLSMICSRGLWVLLLILPFIPIPMSARLTIFLVVLTISYALSGITSNAWLSWMSDLVPIRQRGRYFGFRNTVAGAVSMATTYAAGLVVDYYRARNQEDVAYGFIFGLAVVCAGIGALVLRRQPEPPMKRKERVRIGELFTAPLRNTGFRGYALAAAGWAMVTGIAGPFFNAYGIQALGISFSTLALTGIATSATSLLSQPYVGRLQDKLGDRVVMVVSMFGVVLLPWGWVLSTPTNIIPLWITSLAAGVFWPGINQGMVNVLMDRSPAEGRGAYLASYGAITGVGTFVSGLLGGVLASVLTGFAFTTGPIHLDHFTMLFIVSSLGRLAMAIVFWRRV